jgi:TATA-box binding protein (TBP) (component of TFIID and TFIIIB)
MQSPILTTMVVLYNMGVRVNTDVLVHELPLTDSIIKIEKQGVLRRGESSKDRIRRRNKSEVVPRRMAGFGHNSITLVVMSDGTDHSLLKKEITVKIFQNGVFHITGVLDEKYDRDVTRVLQDHITNRCPQAIVSGEWTPEKRRVVLMNYKTSLPELTNLSRDTLYQTLRNQGIKTNYEPAVHPAVKIYFVDKKWIAKVFRTGQIILTGIIAHEECVELVSALQSMLTPFIRSTQSTPLKA